MHACPMHACSTGADAGDATAATAAAAVLPEGRHGHAGAAQGAHALPCRPGVFNQPPHPSLLWQRRRHVPSTSPAGTCPPRPALAIPSRSRGNLISPPSARSRPFPAAHMCPPRRPPRRRHVSLQGRDVDAFQGDRARARRHEGVAANVARLCVCSAASPRSPLALTRTRTSLAPFASPFASPSPSSHHYQGEHSPRNSRLRSCLSGGTVRMGGGSLQPRTRCVPHAPHDLPTYSMSIGAMPVGMPHAGRQWSVEGLP